MTDRANTRSMLGKIVVSEETGRKFGVIDDVAFVAESGELMNVLVADTTRSAKELGLPEDEKGRLEIPFSAVKSIGDFIIISEKDIV